MSEELKPCPFCAGTRIDDNDAGCVTCGAFADSIEAWNTRPIEDALNAKIDTLLTDPDYVGGVQFWIRKHSDVTRDFANTALSMAERLDEKDAEIARLRTALERLYTYCARQSSPDTRWENGMMTQAREALNPNGEKK